MDEIPKIFVLRRKLSPKIIKRGGDMHKFMYLCPDLVNSSRKIPVFNSEGKKNRFFLKDWVLVQTDIRMQEQL